MGERNEFPYSESVRIPFIYPAMASLNITATVQVSNAFEVSRLVFKYEVLEWPSAFQLSVCRLQRR